MADKGYSPKEIYRVSKERVNLALRLLTPVRQETTNFPGFEKEYENLLGVAKGLVSSHRLEAENDYRTAILNVAIWVLNAVHKDFVATNSKKTPSAIYAIKKGFEVCHLMLHRDLRRRQLSATESQLYFDFDQLSRTLPPPPKDNLVALVNAEKQQQAAQAARKLS